MSVNVKKIQTSLLTFFVFLTFLTMVNAQGTRGVGIKVKSSSGETTQISLYEGSYALVIGNSQYTNGWDNLIGVQSDVIEVSKVLSEQGFAVETAENLTRDQFNQRMNKFINDYGFQPNNRLLIYYAGHGHTMKSSGDVREKGYVVPVDAPNPKNDENGFKRKAIEMNDIQGFAKRIEAKHALFLFDSCFSGKLVSRNAIVIPPIIEEKVSLPVRQFITAGAANQPVPDESVFRRSFVYGLREGDADSNRDGYITGTELAEYLKEKVTNYSNRTQTPQYGKINDFALDKGDFVFVTGKAGTVASVSAVNSTPNSAPTTPSISAVNPAVVAFAEQAFNEAMQGNALEAKNFADRALQLSSDLPLALGARGWAKYHFYDYQGAREDLEKAFRIDPNNPMFQALLTLVYSASNEQTLADRSALKVLVDLKSPTTKLEYYFRGMAKNYLKKYDEAIADYSSAIELDPRFAVAYNDRANTYGFYKKQYDLAIADYTRAIEIDPNYIEPYVGRGTIYQLKKQYDPAIADFNKAIGINPEYSSAYYNRGVIYFLKKIYDLAIADFTKAIEINPKYVNAYYYRGSIYDTKKQFDLAIADFTKTLELNPKFSFAYYSRGFNYLGKKQYDLAIADFTKMIELNPNFINAYYQRGWARSAQKKYDLAIADFTKVIELNPNYKYAYFNRADAYKKIGKTNLAEADLRKFRSL